VIASYRGDTAGTIVLVVGGIHGNEPAGLVAGRRVANLLAGIAQPMAGELVVMAGNRPALAADRRFLDRDMNRRWSSAKLERTRARHPQERSREDREQLELASVFEIVVRETDGDVLYLDLHSTSGEAHPFAVILENEANRALTQALSLPVILDLDAFIDTPSMVWWVERGASAVGIEGGVHGASATVDHLERSIWESLVYAGCLERIPASVTVGRCDEDDGESRSFRVRFRQAVVPGLGFEMFPGFSSFRPITLGEPLAQDRTGEIRAAMDGYVFLPRYQDQGGDGFFILTAESED
jgi:succinylglutamate desuccinylase